MIAVISSLHHERSAFVALCNERGWPCVECDSLRATRRLLHDTALRVVLSRHRLADGFSDDVLAALLTSGRFADARAIVLLEAGASSGCEARQISLGASSTLRDPVRTDVLVAYLEKYRSEATLAHVVARHQLSPRGTFIFAGATVHPFERKICRGSASIRVTPRELELIKFLFEAKGQVVTYQTLYSEMLGRRYRGESSNMRVLLGSLVKSFGVLRVPLRRYIDVIAKTGYLYMDRPAVQKQGERPTPA